MSEYLSYWKSEHAQCSRCGNAYYIHRKVILKVYPLFFCQFLWHCRYLFFFLFGMPSIYLSSWVIHQQCCHNLHQGLKPSWIYLCNPHHCASSSGHTQIRRVFHPGWNWERLAQILHKEYVYALAWRWQNWTPNCRVCASSMEYLATSWRTASLAAATLLPWCWKKTRTC